MSHEDFIKKIDDNKADVFGRLTHDETIRATALAQACGYYVQTICKDGNMYRELVRDNKVLKPATYIGVIETAISFEWYLRGDLKTTAEAIMLKKTLQKMDDEPVKETPEPEVEQ